MSDLIAQTSTSARFQDEFQWASQWPWLLLVLMSLPLVVAAFQTRTFPTAWWVRLLAVSLVLSVLAVFSDAWLLILAMVDGIIFIVTAIDFLLLWIGSGGGSAALGVFTAPVAAADCHSHHAPSRHCDLGPYPPPPNQA